MIPSFALKRSLPQKILLSFFVSILLITKADAQYINIEFVPQTTNTTPGSSFQVIVRADFTAASPLAGIETHFTFDNSKLQATNITNLSQGVLPLIAISPSFNNTTGTVDFAAGTSSSHPTADFNLYSVDFTVLPAATSGSTPLAFNTTTTLAGDPAANDILNSTINGNVVITGVGCTPPEAVISAPGGTTTCNGQAFNLLLSSAPVGTGPFDLTITGPDGTATYNDIAVGSPITTFTPPSLSIWTAPTPVTYNDASYTLGTRFTSSVAGFVKGIRFFSADEVSAVPGNYTGQLWTGTGTLLASGVFVNVTAGGWQELVFATPVLISPGTPYIASYNTGVSTFYASTPGGLAADFTNGPLTALGNGGVFVAGAVPAPPFASVQGNYWVDVLFSPNQYSFNLTSVKDALECINTGALQTLNITSVDCATLPVSLLNLSATPGDNSVLLSWSTASEINNKGFEVQRKTESGDWTAIGFVNGIDNCGSTHHYNYTDNKLSPSRYYYRLKQIDIDGRFEYSPVVSAVIGGAEKFSLEQNYPNPFRSETVIRFTLPGKANVKLTLFDMHGRIVKTVINGSRDKGAHAVTVNSSSLSSGLYYYRLESENFSAVKKMTIQ